MWVTMLRCGWATFKAEGRSPQELRSHWRALVSLPCDAGTADYHRVNHGADPIAVSRYAYCGMARREASSGIAQAASDV